MSFRRHLNKLIDYIANDLKTSPMGLTVHSMATNAYTYKYIFIDLVDLPTLSFSYDLFYLP